MPLIGSSTVSTEAQFNTNPNIRFFGTREAAEHFALTTAPGHSPFETQGIAVMSAYTYSGTLTVDATPDDMHWEYYVGADGTLGNISEQPDEELGGFGCVGPGLYQRRL